LKHHQRYQSQVKKKTSPIKNQKTKLLNQMNGFHYKKHLMISLNHQPHYTQLLLHTYQNLRTHLHLSIHHLLQLTHQLRYSHPLSHLSLQVILSLHQKISINNIPTSIEIPKLFIISHLSKLITYFFQLIDIYQHPPSQLYI
jgi:hypothetical protein